MKKTKAIRLLMILIIIISTIIITACEFDNPEPEPIIDDSEPIIEEPELPIEPESDIIEPELSKHLPPSIFPLSFTTTDLFGNTVNETTLGEKRLFFVHLWGTWCPPCVAEMPELSEVAIMFEDEVGFIGLLDDFKSNKSRALDIKEVSGTPASFLNVDAHLPELAVLLNKLNTGFVPTTILIDGDGKMIGEPIVGARGLEYRTYIEDALNED